MRTRPIALLSSAAVLSVLLLAGCTPSTTDDSEPTPTASAAADLCGAKVASGAASDSVTAEGEVGAEPTATFAAPLEVTEPQSTVIEEGSGDQAEPGAYIQMGLSVYDATSGEKGAARGYNADPLTEQISPDSGVGQLLGCPKPGSRYAVVLPAAPDGSSPATVYVIDVFLVDVFEDAPTAAWGEPQEPVDGMPTVELDEDGSPTVSLPEGDMPTEFSKATLKKGDGAVVEAGDQVLVQYHGVSWNSGEMFQETWGTTPFTFTVGSGVVQGFTDAVTGETVGSQVIAVLPPAVAYGEGEVDPSTHVGETLVFVVDILAVQKPTVAAQ